MKILLIFLLLLINEIEAGKIKEEKSFDEVFGQGWDDGAEENICRIDQIINGETAEKNQNDQQFNRNFDENLKVKEEESEEMSTNCDQMEQLPENVGQICDQTRILNDQLKRKIVEKFHKIKEKIKQNGKKYSTKEWTKIERKIAQKLGTNQRKIYKWKKEFGLIIKNSYSYEQKRKILMQFDQIYGKLKMKLNEKLDGKREKYQKMIAKHLGIHINTIYNWKKELKKGNSVKNQKNAEKKRENVEKYLKNEFMQMRKHSRKEWEKFYVKIKQEFGVNFATIERWAKKIGINQNFSKERQIYSIAEKKEILKKYYKIKEENPTLSDREVSKRLGIPRSSLGQIKTLFAIR